MPQQNDLPRFLTAKQWLCPGPEGPLQKGPVSDVFLHHTVTPPGADPVLSARRIADIGIHRFGRLSYTVLVHPSRTVLWGHLGHVGVHTEGHNSTAVGIALIGNYDIAHVPPTMTFDACVALDVLRRLGIVTRQPNVRPHRDVKQTACPGQWGVADCLPWMRLVAADPSWRP